MSGTHLYLCQTLLGSALGPRLEAGAAVDRLTIMLLSGEPCARCRACRISANINVPFGTGPDQTMEEVHIATLHTGEPLVIAKGANGKYVRVSPDLEDIALRLEPDDDEPEDGGNQPLPADFPDDGGGPPAAPTDDFVQLPLFD